MLILYFVNFQQASNLSFHQTDLDFQELIAHSRY